MPDVYVIESLDPDDEGNGRLEGVWLTQILKLHGKSPRYSYVRTRAQFEDAVKEFGKSKYRYLHISAHGDHHGMATTNLEEIDYDELADILAPHLKGRRLFLSACSMVHDDLATEIIPRTGCYSVVGPKEDIFFTDSAVVWASIYHLMFSVDDAAMRKKTLLAKLKAVRDLFNVELSYFSGSSDTKTGHTGDLLAR